MTRKHRRKKGVEIVSFNPGWIGQGAFSRAKKIRSEIVELYQFYVLETPCENLSSMSVSLTKRGWGKKPWQTKGNRLHARLFTDLGFKVNENLFICTATDETKQLFLDAGLTDSFKRVVKEEKVAFYHSESAQFLSLAKHIRNSLAHGRFSLAMRGGELFFYSEDGVNKRDGFVVRSRVVLKVSTLLEWMRIIKREGIQ